MFNDMNEDEIEKLKSKINSLQMENEQLYRSLTKANEQNRPLRDENNSLNEQIGNLVHNTGVLIRTIESLECENKRLQTELNLKIGQNRQLLNEQKEKLLLEILTSGTTCNSNFQSFLRWINENIGPYTIPNNKIIRIYLSE